jgi:hypothetical protein
MKVDFAKTKQDIVAYLRKQLGRLAKKYPDVKVKLLKLWGDGFHKVVHLCLETSDDETVFGDSSGEYNENEFGSGVRFDDYWPDFYSCAEDEEYEFLMPDGSTRTENPGQDGNAAIDTPLFELLQTILREEDFSNVNKARSLKLAVEMGNGADEAKWTYRKTAANDEVETADSKLSQEEREHIRNMFGHPTWSEEGKYMMWSEQDPETEKLKTFTLNISSKADRKKAKRIFDAATSRSWRTPEELALLLQAPGPWLIRWNLTDRFYYFLTTNDTAAIFAGDIDDVRSDDEKQAARFTSQEAMGVIVKLTEIQQAEDPEASSFYEPVRSDQATTDLRLER